MNIHHKIAEGLITPLVLAAGLSTWVIPSHHLLAQSADTVLRIDGSPVRGTITASVRQGVKVDGTGGSTNVGTNQIKRIIFSGEPAPLRQAKETMAKGDLEQAMRALDRVDESEIQRELVRAELRFYRALLSSKLALKTGDGHAAAAKQMVDFVKARPDSFHFYEAAEVLGDLAVALGRFDSAAKYYGQLEKSPWPELRFRGAVLLAEALRAQGPAQLDEVLQRYDEIAEADVEGPEAQRQKQIAVLRRAAIRAELGEPSASLEEIESVIADADMMDAELLATAYNALGAYHRHAEQPTDAVLAYLHVDLLFASNQAAHAEALFYLSQLWGTIGKPDRGIDAANRLKTNYGGSWWAKQ